jgi:hypothetical protein
MNTKIDAIIRNIKSNAMEISRINTSQNVVAKIGQINPEVISVSLEVNFNKT